MKFETKNCGGNAESVADYLNELSKNNKHLKFVNVIFAQGFKVIVGYD